MRAAQVVCEGSGASWGWGRMNSSFPPEQLVKSGGKLAVVSKAATNTRKEGDAESGKPVDTTPMIEFHHQRGASNRAEIATKG